VRFIMSAGKTTPLAVQFEPSGAEYVLQPGDHLVIEWPDIPTRFPDGPNSSEHYASIEHSPTGVVVIEPDCGLESRIWDSSGNELSILG
jgi:hypothetical protein